MNKLICLGFIWQPKSSPTKIVTHDFITSKDANYEIDIAGNKFSATPYLYTPLITNNVAQYRKYKPTVIKYKSDISQ